MGGPDAAHCSNLMPQEWFAPNYFSVVKHPMDFSTMYTRVLDEDYTSWAGFEEDFELICANAMLYNVKSSKVYTLAAKLRDQGRRVIQQAKSPPREVRRTLVRTNRPPPSAYAFPSPHQPLHPPPLVPALAIPSAFWASSSSS